MNDKYEPVIGVEIHIQLATNTNMFCSTASHDSENPNELTCPICLGHPGALPQLNMEAVEIGTVLSHALNAEVQEYMKFDRKHYFYPDLPKGYQISQFDQPLALHGYLDISPEAGEVRRIGIERLHLEEDSAKLKHGVGGLTLVDFNRAGAPLVELVTKPDLKTPEEAKLFVQELAQIVRFIGASNADLSKGHMRCDANISLRPVGDEALYPKTEIKNMNSFRAIERAIAYEIERQTELWESNEAPEITTTRGWDDKRGVTVEQRTKEDAADYRYFPEPDIPPVRRTREEIDALKSKVPELPAQRRARFMEEYELSYHDARTLLLEPEVGEFFERTISELRAWLNSLDDTEGSDEEIWKKYRKKVGRLTSSWITTEIFGIAKKKGESFNDNNIDPENFAELLTLVYEKRVNSTAAQQILLYMYEHGGDPSVIMQEQDLEQTSDTDAVGEIVDGIIASNASVVEDYKGGKDKALMYLVGQVMKETKGKVNPEVATTLLKEKLD